MKKHILKLITGYVNIKEEGQCGAHIRLTYEALKFPTPDFHPRPRKQKSLRENRGIRKCLTIQITTIHVQDLGPLRVRHMRWHKIWWSLCIWAKTWGSDGSYLGHRVATGHRMSDPDIENTERGMIHKLRTLF